jgi:hypothetical protein
MTTPGSASSGQPAWMTGLLAVWFCLLFGGFLLGKPSPRSDRRMPLWARTGSSAVLVIASWIWFYLAMSTDASLFAALIATGMSLGFVGDLLMARLIPVIRHVLAAMAVFGLGHVAYTLAMATFVAKYPPANPKSCLGAWVGWTIAGVTGWWLVVYRKSRRTKLEWAALLYTLLAAGTAGLSTCLALQNANFIPAAIGAALFLLSDTLLAAHLFGGFRFHLIRDLVWLIYGPAQMLIIYSVPAAIGAVAQ